MTLTRGIFSTGFLLRRERHGVGSVKFADGFLRIKAVRQKVRLTRVVLESIAHRHGDVAELFQVFVTFIIWATCFHGKIASADDGRQLVHHVVGKQADGVVARGFFVLHFGAAFSLPDESLTSPRGYLGGSDSIRRGSLG